MRSVTQFNSSQYNGSLSLGKDERGLSTVEYVIVLVLIAVGAIGLWKAFGGAVNTRIDASATSIRDMKATDGSNGNAQSAGTTQPATPSQAVGNYQSPAPADRSGPRGKKED